MNSSSTVYTICLIGLLLVVGGSGSSNDPADTRQAFSYDAIDPEPCRSELSRIMGNVNRIAAAPREIDS